MVRRVSKKLAERRKRNIKFARIGDEINKFPSRIASPSNRLPELSGEICANGFGSNLPDQFDRVALNDQQVVTFRHFVEEALIHRARDRAPYSNGMLPEDTLKF